MYIRKKKACYYNKPNPQIQKRRENTMNMFDGQE